MKKKIAIIIVVLVSILIYIIINSYYNYKDIYNIFNSHLWFDLERVFIDYYDKKGNYPIKKEKFQSFIEDGKSYNDFSYYLGKVDYDIIHKNDSIIVYSFGFDKDDDKRVKNYTLNSINFVNSFFIDGDITLFIFNTDKAQKKDIIPNTNFKTIPSPPPTIINLKLEPDTSK